MKCTCMEPRLWHLLWVSPPSETLSTYKQRSKIAIQNAPNWLNENTYALKTLPTSRTLSVSFHFHPQSRIYQASKGTWTRAHQIWHG